MSGIGAGNIERVLYPYSPLYAEDFPFILFWIPKSGCTMATRWFFYQIGLLQDIERRTGGEVHSYRNEIYTHRPGYADNLRHALAEKTKDTYKLVRNPYRRAVSSYLSTICSPWLIGLVQGDLQMGMSFKQFLYRLQKLGDDIHCLDRHLGPQYLPGEEHAVRDYLYLESFETQIREIERKYGLCTSPLACLSQSQHHFNRLMVKEGEFAETVLTRETFNWYFPTCESMYDRETRELVRDIYQIDFKVYGFEENHE